MEKEDLKAPGSDGAFTWSLGVFVKLRVQRDRCLPGLTGTSTGKDIDLTKSGLKCDKSALIILNQ
ncbi:MAG: hypothetical protein CR997_08835 [Acidobacteria bacterium]|nr:MAG: hypothetical protein CR997_08835 [Acidobacteriota bacterium]